MKRKQQQAHTFAERLRELVDASGMTQGEVARRAGVSPQVVSRLLTTGNADVTLSVACRLAWAIGKSVNEFEEVVFEEWQMQPQTMQLIDREMSRGRVRQKLNTIRDRIAEWEATLPTGEGEADRMTRRWIEGMVRYWREQAQGLEARLSEIESKTASEKKQDDLFDSVFRAARDMGYVLAGMQEPLPPCLVQTPDRTGAEDDLWHAVDELRTDLGLRGNTSEDRIKSLHTKGGPAWRREALANVILANALIEQHDSAADRRAFHLLGQAVWAKHDNEPGEFGWEREIKEIWPARPPRVSDQDRVP